MHHITGAKVFKGELVQQYVIYYRHSIEHLVDLALPKDTMDYYVKIILHADELQDKEIEVDMFFGRVPLSQIGKDIVFNVHAANLTSGGTFYTDTNGLRFMERVAN